MRASAEEAERPGCFGREKLKERRRGRKKEKKKKELRGKESEWKAAMALSSLWFDSSDVAPHL